jgi:hypothetical protein
MADPAPVTNVNLHTLETDGYAHAQINTEALATVPALKTLTSVQLLAMVKPFAAVKRNAPLRSL